ncbi:MAG: phosphoenolpyruvate carboxykinase domain-containing protein, partial [Caldimonas sp.]
QGIVRRDPFAMLPFTGYNMSEYFRHWLDLGATLAARNVTLPKIFCVNWFRKGADGKFLWPGYGENMRVLQWIVRRVDGKADGELTAFGTTPRYADIDWSGLDFDRAHFERVTDLDAESWAGELELHDALFSQLAYQLPDELPEVRRRIAARLAG